MEQILYSLTDYKVLAIIVGFILIAVETFLPVLPLIAIVVANAFVLGMWMGFLVSWVGSGVASVALYLVVNKFSKWKYFEKYQEKNKIKKVIIWIKKQGFNSIFISYACPFIPDFLVTVGSGFTGLDLKTFVPGMVCGKFVMFLLISYVGEDINHIISHPMKIVVFICAILISWVIGQRINKKIHKNGSNK